MSHLRLFLPVSLALLPACKEAANPCALPCDSGAPEAAACGPQLSTADFDPSWGPTAAGLDPDRDSIPLTLSGEPDQGHPGVAYSVLLASHYHIRIQRPVDCDDESGSPCEPFGYLYDPARDVWEDDESTARQVVGTLAQVRIYDLLRRPEVLISANDALRLLARRVTWNSTGAWMADLGSTGLTAMAMAEHKRVTGTSEFDEIIDGLGATLLSRVEEDGSYPTGSSLKFAQTHNTMWKLYAATGDEAYLDALRRMARHASENTDKTDVGEYFEFPYIYGLWSNEPLTELYKLDGEDWIRDLVFLVGDDVIHRQYMEEEPGVLPDQCAWVGGFTPNDGDGAPNWNSTIKLEAMVDAWRMADLVGDADRERDYRRSAEAGVAWLMSDQYRAGTTDDYPDPDAAIGGFPLFADDPDVRIDIPGHGSIALAKASAWLLEEETPGDFGSR